MRNAYVSKMSRRSKMSTSSGKQDASSPKIIVAAPQGWQKQKNEMKSQWTTFGHVEDFTVILDKLSRR
ncbi:MAG TPA: hypothetical protein VEC97_05020 [Candidatus Acidoferrales bacterium]|nr:hypothetical protein [Candidatus Acidoferrales bacterium]